MFPDPENPEPENMEKDTASMGTPDTCNGTADRKVCKHQSIRDRIEREKELLRRQEETPNQDEEGQDSGKEGEEHKTELRLRKKEEKEEEGKLHVGNTPRTSGGQTGHLRYSLLKIK